MSKEIPYDPIREPRKHVSQERMREILARHAKAVRSETAPIGDEIWFAAKLKSVLGISADVFAGVTTREDRKVRARELLQSVGERKCGRRQGRDCTFAEVFELIYGEAA